MTDVQTMFPHPKTRDKRPAVWRDKAGVLHRAIGSQMVSFDRGTFIMWTACQKKDIPADSAWLQNPSDTVTSEGCLAATRIEEEEQHEAELADGQFGVGA